MKKRNKKYNPRAKAFTLARVFAQKFVIAWAGTIEAQIMRRRNFEKETLTMREVNALNQVPHKWQVHVLCTLRDHCGRDYIQSQELIFNNEYYCADISDLVNEKMHEFVKTCNQNHMVNVGWVATPCMNELSDEDLAKIMDKLGAWDFLAKHEVNDSTEVLQLEKQA